MGKKILPYGLALLAFCGIYDALPVRLPLAIMWMLAFLILASFAYSRKYFQQDNMMLVNLYLIWNVICIIRGCFVAEIYWDWKNLINTGFGMLIPVMCYAFTSPQFNRILLRNLIKYSGVLFLLVLFPLRSSDRPGRFLTFFYLFMICISILPRKWKILTLGVVLFSCFYDLDARSNVIRAVVALFIGLLFYYRGHVCKYFKVIQRYVPFIPIFLFVLATLNIFNIFKMDDYMGEYTVGKMVDGKEEDVSLTADTRTFLYKEVIASSIKNSHVVWGRTPARGYESFWFDFSELQAIGIRPSERHGTEVSVLNVFLHTGLIGLVLYFLVFYYSSYLAIFRSCNIYIKLIGLFVIFRWCYGWIEDFNQLDINYAMLWMFIAMCYSNQYRSMTDSQFKDWLLSVIREKRRIYE